jgi:hypothetical protein
MVQQVPPPPSTLRQAQGSGQAGKPRKPRHDDWTREKMAGFLRELAATQPVAAAAVAAGMGRLAERVSGRRGESASPRHPVALSPVGL